MNKVDLINEVAKFTHSRIEAGRAVNVFLETIKKSLKEGNRVTITGFGTFSVAKRSARTGIIPRTGNPMRFASKKVPRFNADKALQYAVK